MLNIAIVLKDFEAYYMSFTKFLNGSWQKKNAHMLMS